MDLGLSSCRIVLAEDNPADIGLVRRALREHAIHCDLRVISDGEEVVSFIKGLDRDSELPCPDLLLLDMHLPKRDGNEVLKHLRASERCGRTPVVLFTSSDPAWALQNAEGNGATHYFQKPSSLEKFMQLGTVIKEVIGGAPPC